MKRPVSTSSSLAPPLSRALAVFVIGAAVLLGMPAEARPETLSVAVNNAVRAAKRVAPATGVHVARLSDGEAVYSYNAETPRILASNTKLLTTAAALDRLGPGHFFETEILTRGRVVGGTLTGELAIVGGGDPHLSGRGYFGDSYGAFRGWAEALRARGIRRVEGDLVLVHGYFDDQWVHPDWPRNQLAKWYEAPVSSLSFNDNCILVKVSPDRVAGRPARVETVPRLPTFEVQSTAKTTSKRKAHRVAIDRRPRGDTLTVDGWVYRGRRTSVDAWVAVNDPLRYFGEALRAALAEEGIVVTGAVKRRPTLDGVGWQAAHVHRTDLLTVLDVVNKRSQNFYAESVIKTLGADLCGEGTWDRGLEVVRDFLHDVGVGPVASLADGSGMSRNNRATPAQLTTLLRAMAGHRWGKVFMQTLPYSGEDGLSWSKRLARAPYRGNVMAKTGSLRAVSTLSGYVKARSGTRYVFSILLNQSRSGWQAKDAQDAILRAIIDFG